MKSLLSKMLPGLLLVWALNGSAWAQGRFATVDLRKLFDNYWKTKQADAALKDRAAEIEKDHKTMLDDWSKAKEEYQNLLTEANNQNLSLEERDKRKKAAEDKLKQIKDTGDTIGQYERQARTTLDEQTKRMRSSIVEEIRTTVKGKASSAGYALVLDTTAESVTGAPVVLYSNNENDITEAVLAQLNAGAPVDTPKTEDKPISKKDDKSEKKKDRK